MSEYKILCVNGRDRRIYEKGSRVEADTYYEQLVGMFEKVQMFEILQDGKEREINKRGRL